MSFDARFLLVASVLFATSLAPLAHAAQSETLLDMKLQSVRLSKSALQAHAGIDAAFADLRDGRDHLHNDIDALHNLKTKDNCATKAPADVSANLRQLDEQNRKLLVASDAILKHEADIKAVRQAMFAIDAAQPELSEMLQDLQGNLLKNHGSPHQIGAVGSMLLMNARLAVSADRFVKDDVLSPEVAFWLAKDIANFRELLNASLAGNDKLTIEAVKSPEAVKQFNAVSQRLQPVEQQVKVMLAHVDSTIEIKQANQSLQDTARDFERVAEAVRAQVGDKTSCGN